MAENNNSISRLPSPTLETLVRQWEDAKLEALRAYGQGLDPAPADAVFDDRMEKVFALERRIGAAAVTSPDDLRAAAAFLDSLLRDLMGRRAAMLPVLVLDAVAAYAHTLERGRAAA